jgi:hypothetical protein
VNPCPQQAEEQDGKGKHQQAANLPPAFHLPGHGYDAILSWT